jgi:hypothetical protein
MMDRVSKLSDKAMLVKLTTRRVGLTKKDQHLTAQLQSQENDASITVLTKLFKDKTGPIHKIMSQVNGVYAYHKTNTLPYIDSGPRILPNTLYFEYTQEVKQRIAVVEALLDNYMPVYDQLVAEDIAYRNFGKAVGRADASEYPTADKFRSSISMDFRFQPMPDSRHFLFDLNDDDLQAVARAEEEAVAQANADTVNRMLKPLGALVERLKEYQGEKGERFHNAVIENVLEGCSMARKLALNMNDGLAHEITALETMAKGYLDHVEIIKASPLARDEARRRLAEAADKMAAFF